MIAGSRRGWLRRGQSGDRLAPLRHVREADEGDVMGKFDPDKVPDGYEVDTDMFGFPLWYCFCFPLRLSVVRC